MSSDRIRSILLLLFTLIFQSTALSQDLDEGLITHFKFDEVSGNIAYDSSDSDFDSQVLGGTQWGEGYLDGAIEFNGLDAKIAMGQPDEYDMSSYSIACWFKNDDASQFRVLTARNAHWKDRQWWLTIWQVGYSSGRDAKLVFRMSPQSGTYVDLVSSTRVDDNQWHAAVVTIDSSNGGTAKLYLDNVLQHTITGFGTPKIPNATAYVGRDISGSKRFYKGSLDDFRIYNRVLSAEEVELFSQAPPPIYYVRKRGSDSNDGLSPSTAFRTIQNAINNCTVEGTTVYVGPGIYQEDISIGSGDGVDAISGTEQSPISVIADRNGDYTNDIAGDVIIEGGYTRSYGIMLDGLQHWQFDGFAINNQIDYCIVAPNAGFAITNCTMDVPAGYAVYSTPTSDVTISDCTFVRSSDSSHCVWLTPENTTTPSTIIINQNDLSLKGSLYNSSGLAKGGGSTPSLYYRPNTAYGIAVTGARKPIIERLEIKNNQISDCDVGIYTSLHITDANEHLILNNTVTNSYIPVYMYAYAPSAALISNNIISNSYYGLLTLPSNNAAPSVTGLLEHNINYDMSGFNRAYESAIITSSPRFTDPEIGDFSLQRGSPAIDAGTSSNAPSTDIAGNPRPDDGDEDGVAQVDLGAYEIVTEPTRARVVQWREIGIDTDR